MYDKNAEQKACIDEYLYIGQNIGDFFLWLNERVSTVASRRASVRSIYVLLRFALVYIVSFLLYNFDVLMVPFTFVVLLGVDEITNIGMRF